MARVGGVGADPFVFAVAVVEADQAQVFEPVALLLGDREDHRVRQRSFRGGDGPSPRRSASDMLASSSSTEVANALCGQSSNRPSGCAMPSRKTIELMCPSPTARRLITKRHRAPDAARLIGVRHDRRVHQRGGRIGVFVAEIGADQLAPHRREIALPEAERRLELLVALLEHRSVCQWRSLKSVSDLAILLAHAGSRSARRRRRPAAAHDCSALRRLPAQVKRPQHDPRRVGVQPGIKYVQGAVGRP